MALSLVAMLDRLPPLQDPAARSYSTHVDGGMPLGVRMQVSGEIGGDYLDFVAERAAWLSLGGWVEQDSDSRVTVVAAGPEALVGALEMACLLGPSDTLVHSLDLVDEGGRIPADFVVRR